MRVPLILLLTFAFTIAGCTTPDDSMEDGTGGGDGGSMDDGDGSSMEEPTTHTVQAGSGTFSPAELTIRVGDTVRFEFSGTHTATSDDGGATFDSGSKSSGDAFEWTATEAGAIPYHCTFHGSPGSGMHGTIAVEG